MNHMQATIAVIGGGASGLVAAIEAKKRLSSHGFVSPSRGFLVNLHQIRSITSTRLLLNNGFELPISRRRSKELQNIYSQHIINIL